MTNAERAQELADQITEWFEGSATVMPAMMARSMTRNLIAASTRNGGRE